MINRKEAAQDELLKTPSGLWLKTRQYSSHIEFFWRTEIIRNGMTMQALDINGEVDSEYQAGERPLDSTWISAGKIQMVEIVRRISALGLKPNLCCWQNALIDHVQGLVMAGWGNNMDETVERITEGFEDWSKSPFILKARYKVAHSDTRHQKNGYREICPVLQDREIEGMNETLLSGMHFFVNVLRDDRHEKTMVTFETETGTLVHVPLTEPDEFALFLMSIPVG